MTNPSLEPAAAVIVAAGFGVRLGADVPKALVNLAGHPLVWWAARALAPVVEQIIVTAPRGHQRAISDALEADFSSALVVTGGDTRQESVAVALRRLKGLAPRPKWVLVHDAARPLMPTSVAEEVLATLHAGAQVVTPVLAVADSVRQLTDQTSIAIDREQLRTVQTPQGFELDALAAAHERFAGVAATDDVGLCERAGCRVELVPGHPAGHKITDPFDLELAVLWATHLAS